MELIDFILHFDQYLAQIIESFGGWTYAILFLIIFAETGLVVTPFLPGDSLLFAVGSFAGTGLLNIWIVYGGMLLAAVVGDSVNYWVGNRIGPRVFAKDNSWIFKKEHLAKTQSFYEKYGGKTLILARFVPIVRTFAPFVAGVGSMRYPLFFAYNVVGAFVWVTSLTFLGYFFGGLPIVQANFEYVILGIIFVSIVPMVVEILRAWLGGKKEEEVSEVSYQDIQETFEEKDLESKG